MRSRKGALEDALLRPVARKPRVQSRESVRSGRTFAEQLSEAMMAAERRPIGMTGGIPPTGSAPAVSSVPLTSGGSQGTRQAYGPGWLWVEDSLRREKKSAAGEAKGD